MEDSESENVDTLCRRTPRITAGTQLHPGFHNVQHEIAPARGAASSLRGEDILLVKSLWSFLFQTSTTQKRRWRKVDYRCGSRADVLRELGKQVISLLLHLQVRRVVERSQERVNGAA